jgi:hypothetical protein
MAERELTISCMHPHLEFTNKTGVNMLVYSLPCIGRKKTATNDNSQGEGTPENWETRRLRETKIQVKWNAPTSGE